MTTTPEQAAEHGARDAFLVGGILATVLIGIGLLTQNVEASQAIVDAAQATAQAFHLQYLLGPGIADCVITYGGEVHQVAQALVEPGSTILKTVGPHLTGTGDSLHLVTEQAKIVEEVLSQTDAATVFEQIVNQAIACSR